MASGLRIAFSYKAQSGKDTCADYAITKHDGYVVKFAEHLYNLMYKIQDHLGFEKKKDARLLQMIGTGYARSIDENIWVKHTVGKINQMTREDPSVNIFVTDARFPNEIEALKNLGFTVCKINRSEENKGDIGRDTSHPSEVSLDDYTAWDFVIENNETLEDLYKKVDNIINKVK